MNRLEQPLDPSALVRDLRIGQQQIVEIAKALSHNVRVLIMDEPTDGLDPNQKHSVRELLRAMAPRKAIIVSTHLLEEVEAICTRAVIIDRGRIVADGTPDPPSSVVEQRLLSLLYQRATGQTL